MCLFHSLTCIYKAHDCSIVKVTWAHPEFGNVFASCSFDRTVKIWEENEHGIVCNNIILLS